MLNNQKQLNLLGLATRARLLVAGEETVLTEVRKGAATLVIVATDCSDGTKKKLADKCHHYKVPCIEYFTTMEISGAIGKKRAICAFVDSGFATSFQKLMPEQAIK